MLCHEVGHRRLGGDRRRGDQAVRLHAVPPRARRRRALHPARPDLPRLAGAARRRPPVPDRSSRPRTSTRRCRPGSRTRIGEALNEAGKAVKGAAVLVLGVAYKPDVGDVRESPALKVIGICCRRGAKVAFHDPFVEHVALNGWQLAPHRADDARGRAAPTASRSSRRTPRTTSNGWPSTRSSCSTRGTRYGAAAPRDRGATVTERLPSASRTSCNGTRARRARRWLPGDDEVHVSPGPAAVVWDLLSEDVTRDELTEEVARRLRSADARSAPRSRGASNLTRSRPRGGALVTDAGDQATTAHAVAAFGLDGPEPETSM